MSKTNGTTNGTGGTAGASAESAGEAARQAYFAQLERVCDALRAHLDTFGETIRRTRRVEAIDRGPTDREVALQLRLTAATFLEVADGLAPPPAARSRAQDEVTTETKRIKREGSWVGQKRRPDSEPGHKR